MVSDSILGLIRNLLLSTAALAIVGCPGDPTEANTNGGTGSASADDSVSAEASVSQSADDSASASASASETSDPTDTDPSDSDTDTGNDPDCGNGLVEPPETCDLGPNNTMGATCTNECTDNVCGDSYVGYGESCDPPGGGCQDTCVLESCGDGVIDGSIGEECDPPMQGTCSPTCTNPGCGDGIIQRNLGEQCEGNDLGGDTCITEGHLGGELQCDVECHFVTSACTDCGDGALQAPEQCDGNVGAHTCVEQGYDEGTLLCNAACAFDTSGCIDAVCGDNVAEGMEVCDGADLNAHTCQSEGFAPGAGILCDTCELDTSGCDFCGNGVIDAGEDCDGGLVPINNCSDLEGDFDQGNVTCMNCEYNTSQCCSDDIGDECTDNTSCCGNNLDCGGMSGCCIPGGQSCQGSSANCCDGSCTMGGNGNC